MLLIDYYTILEKTCLTNTDVFYFKNIKEILEYTHNHSANQLAIELEMTSESLCASHYCQECNNRLVIDCVHGEKAKEIKCLMGIAREGHGSPLLNSL